MSKVLDVFQNYQSLTCENKSRILFYEGKQFKLCDVTNVKIFWSPFEVLIK